jgi:hypothetical protein
MNPLLNLIPTRHKVSNLKIYRFRIIIRKKISRSKSQELGREEGVARVKLTKSYRLSPSLDATTIIQ